MAAPLAAAPAVLSVGARALSYARANAPAIYDKAKAYIATSKVDVNTLLSSNNRGSSEAVLTALAASGMDLEQFTNSGELSPAEAKLYEGHLRKLRKAMREKSDVHAVAVGTGSDDFDVAAIELAEVSRLLAMSPARLYKVKRVFDRMSEDFVQRYEAKIRAGVRYG